MGTIEEARECLKEGWHQHQALRVVSDLLNRLQETQDWFDFYNGESDIGTQGWYKLEKILED